MTRYIIAMNGVNMARLNESLSPARNVGRFKLLRCEDVAALHGLPQRDYSYFVIGTSGVISPQDMTDWLESSQVSRQAPASGAKVLFQGDVAQHEAYRRVIFGHFGMALGAATLLIINSPDQGIAAAMREMLGGVQPLVCRSLFELRKLPKGFYENILIGAAPDIMVEELEEWMDSTIPLHLQHQVNVIWTGGDERFLDVHRRHNPR